MMRITTPYANAIGFTLPILAFAFVAGLIGFLFICNIGPQAGPDMQDMHYKSSLSVATGQIFKKVDQTSQRQMIEGPERWMMSGTNCGIKNDLVSNLTLQPLSRDKLYACQKAGDAKLSDEKVVEVGARTQYMLFGWLPQAAGLAMGMSLGLEPVDAQNLGRVLNLLVYITVISMAIILVPRGKWLVAAISVLPTSLFLASSLSSDALNIAWATLFICYVFRLYTQKTRLRKRQLVIVCTLGLGLFLLKVAYVPLLLLVFALKKQVATRKQQLAIVGGTTLVGVLVYLVWSSNWSATAALVDVQSNKEFILANPLKAMIGVALNTFYLFNIPHSIVQTQIENAYIALILITFIVAYLYTAKPAKPKNARDFWDYYGVVVMCLIAAVATIALTYSALLLTWTNTRADGFMLIAGFQGRYVLPLLPLLVSFLFITEKTQRRR